MSGAEFLFNSRSLKIYNLEEKKEILPPEFARRETIFAISPDSRTIASRFDKSIKLWNVETGTEIFTLKGPDDFISSIEFTPDGKFLITKSGDDLIRVWDIEQRKEIRSFPSSEYHDLTLSPNGQIIAEISNLRERQTNNQQTYDYEINSKIIKLSNISDGKTTQILKGSSLSFSSLEISPEKSFIAVNTNDQSTKIWDLIKAKENGVLEDIYANTPLIYSSDSF